MPTRSASQSQGQSQSQSQRGFRSADRFAATAHNETRRQLKYGRILPMDEPRGFAGLVGRMLGR